MSLEFVLIILVVLAIVLGNIAMLKHVSKIDLKNLNKDPVTRARENLDKKQSSTEKSAEERATAEQKKEES